MQPSKPTTKAMLWAGRSLTMLTAMFFLLDAIMKLAKPVQVVQATVQLGYSERAILPLGIVLLTCTVLYLIPRTVVLGAIFLTGYLGGAVATQIHAGAGWFEILFPVIFGILLWGGIFLRDHRLRELVPCRIKP